MNCMKNVDECHISMEVPIILHKIYTIVIFCTNIIEYNSL